MSGLEFWVVKMLRIMTVGNSFLSRYPLLGSTSFSIINEVEEVSYYLPFWKGGWTLSQIKVTVLKWSYSWLLDQILEILYVTPILINVQINNLSFYFFQKFHWNWKLQSVSFTMMLNMPYSDAILKNDFMA